MSATTGPKAAVASGSRVRITRASLPKIVVIGGTGLIGSKLVKNLRDRGHEVLAASPNTGVNTITREGLAEAVNGAEVVVDVANAPAWATSAAGTLIEVRCHLRAIPRCSKLFRIVSIKSCRVSAQCDVSAQYSILSVVLSAVRLSE